MITTVAVIALVFSCAAITFTFIARFDKKNGDETKMNDDYEERLQKLEEKLKIQGKTYTPTISEIKPVEVLQISNYRGNGGGVAEFAIDGDEETFTLTEKEIHPWWCADMGGIYHVNRVVVINRDDVRSERSINLQVGVTNTKPVVGQKLALDAYTLCKEKPGLMGEVGSVSCPDDVSGRYLVVQFKTENWMNIAEVNIYGYEIQQ